MKGSFVKLDTTPVNSISVPTGAVPAMKPVSSFRVTSGVVASEMPSTISLGLRAGFCSITLPLNFSTPMAPPGKWASFTLEAK
ncbi:MAG: hypothetical protein HY822_00935 [Acidobacteria bacterium]|nr:hypothetical protein [Acidobacteriota bacterium]